jgi:hypothetical protein
MKALNQVQINFLHFIALSLLNHHNLPSLYKVDVQIYYPCKLTWNESFCILISLYISYDME